VRESLCVCVRERKVRVCEKQDNVRHPQTNVNPLAATCSLFLCGGKEPYIARSFLDKSPANFNLHTYVYRIGVVGCCDFLRRLCVCISVCSEG